VNIVVFIAGVLDPKWPAASNLCGLPTRQADRVIMSPFDEAALEIALKIRDAHPATTVRAFVAGGEDGARLARAIAAFNIADLSTVQLDRPWDQSGVARELAQLCGQADLILLGREFGDCDDGLIPPLLASLLGATFIARTQIVEAKGEVRDARVRQFRGMVWHERAGCCERHQRPPEPVAEAPDEERDARPPGAHRPC
jgi:electron transfer flavoprotein beta subunit